MHDSVFISIFCINTDPESFKCVSVWRTFLTQILKVQIQEQMIFNCQYGLDFKLLWANATAEIENCVKCLTLFELG